MNGLVDDDLGGQPRIALFHSKSVHADSTFSSNTASQTDLEGIVMPGEYEYFQVCVAEHKHYLKVSLDLKRVPPAVKGVIDYREIDLYISLDDKHPKLDTSTWISRDEGDDTITIPTYVSAFEDTTSHTIYVGVHSRPSDLGEPISFVLSVSIVDVEVRDALKRGRLRGGQRVLPGQAPLEYQ